MKNSYIVLGLVLLGIGGGYALMRPTSQKETARQTTDTGQTPIVSVTVPEFTGNAGIGEKIFSNICAACHGPAGAGNDGYGPPLIHKIYEPSHHGDEAFQRAVAYGVKGHHWGFGNMPPQEGLTRGDVSMVITYVREVQRANGIK